MNKIINKYIFNAEKINTSIKIVLSRTQYYIDETDDVEKQKIFKGLCNDYIKIANTIIEPSKKEYNLEYYNCCIDAMTEINFRMAELEKESVKKRSKRRVCNKYFKDIRDSISTYSGMKRVVSGIMIIILITIPIIRVLKEFIKEVVGFSILKDHTYALVQPIIDFCICLLPASLAYLLFIPLLKKMLLKSRVCRESQRETILGLLTIFITIFIAVLV